jgi:chaperone required for assembly of F1-ATPase
MTGQDEPSLTLPRRFYRTVTVTQLAEGYAPQLDGRTPRSPGHRPLVTPTEALAALLAEEWDAQVDVIDTARMPAVRLAFTALDRVAETRTEIADELARFAGSDVICYFADAPKDLAEAEAEVWMPWMTWADERLGVTLSPVSGVIHRPQPAEALQRVRELALAEDDFTLAGLAFGAALLGSAVLAFAVRHGALPAVEAYEVSRFDEAFQARRWGLDAEAERRRAAMTAEADMLGRWFAAHHRHG